MTKLDAQGHLLPYDDYVRAQISQYVQLAREGQILAAYHGARALRENTEGKLAIALECMTDFYSHFHAMMMRMNVELPWQYHPLNPQKIMHGGAWPAQEFGLLAEEHRINQEAQHLSQSRQGRALLSFAYAKYALTLVDGLRVYLWCWRSLDLFTPEELPQDARELRDEFRRAVETSIGMPQYTMTPTPSMSESGYGSVQLCIDYLRTLTDKDPLDVCKTLYPALGALEAAICTSGALLPRSSAQTSSGIAVWRRQIFPPPEGSSMPDTPAKKEMPRDLVQRLRTDYRLHLQTLAEQNLAAAFVELFDLQRFLRHVFTDYSAIEYYTVRSTQALFDFKFVLNKKRDGRFRSAHNVCPLCTFEAMSEGRQIEITIPLPSGPKIAIGNPFAQAFTNTPIPHLTIASAEHIDHDQWFRMAEVVVKDTVALAKQLGEGWHVFVNGPGAGRTLRHCHMQVLQIGAAALPLLALAMKQSEGRDGLFQVDEYPLSAFYCCTSDTQELVETIGVMARRWYDVEEATGNLIAHCVAGRCGLLFVPRVCGVHRMAGLLNEPGALEVSGVFIESSDEGERLFHSRGFHNWDYYHRVLQTMRVELPTP